MGLSIARSVTAGQWSSPITAQKTFFWEKLKRCIQKIVQFVLAPFKAIAAFFKRLFRKKKEPVFEKCEEKKGEYCFGEKTFESSRPEVPPDYLKNFHWPLKLSKIDVTPEQKEETNDVLHKVFHEMRHHPFDYELVFSKTGPKGARIRKLFLKRSNSQTVVHEYRVPRSLEVIYRTSLLSDVILLSKKKVGTGGQTSVRVCFSFLSGKYSVRKKCAGFFHRFWLNEIQGHQPPLRGIVPVLGFREGEKTQVYEPLYKETLESFLSNSESHLLATKLSIIEDLLFGLVNLHRLSHPGIAYDNCTSFHIRPLYGRLYPENSGPFHFAHFDLKPTNVLIQKEGGSWKTVITDLGAASPFGVGGTFGFRSPERLEFGKKFNRRFLIEPWPKEILEFNQKFGQLSDVWSLGLVIVILLVGRGSCLIPNGTIPPLKCMEDRLTSHALQKKNSSSFGFPIIRLAETKTRDSLHLEEKCFSGLTQKDVEDSLFLLKAESTAKLDLNHPDAIQIHKLWDLAQKMLQVAPNQRIKAEQALREFQSFC